MCFRVTVTGLYFLTTRHPVLKSWYCIRRLLVLRSKTPVWNLDILISIGTDFDRVLLSLTDLKQEELYVSISFA